MDNFSNSDKPNQRRIDGIDKQLYPPDKSIKSCWYLALAFPIDL